jgi:hypothetical protein
MSLLKFIGKYFITSPPYNMEAAVRANSILVRVAGKVPDVDVVESSIFCRFISLVHCINRGEGQVLKFVLGVKT